MNPPINLFKAVLLVSCIVLLLNSCGGGGGKVSTSTPVNPSNAGAIFEVLISPGTIKVDGSLPESSNDANKPEITRSETNISYAAGGQVILPVDYQGNNQGDVAQILYSVKGSDSYSQIDTTGAGSTGTITVPINIPSNVSEGEFCLDVRLVDSNGLVSANEEICITVASPITCNTTNNSGGEGLTSTLLEMNGTRGSVLVDYETFTIKDKIDVFQEGVWLGGTGPLTKREDIRTALDCSVATEDKGYVGEEGTFLFYFDPSPGGDVEIIVSGCENGGTKWEYTASCPGGSGGVYNVVENSNSKVVFSEINNSYLFSHYFLAGGLCEKVGNETYVVGEDGIVLVSIADEEGIEELTITEDEFNTFLNTDFNKNYTRSNEPLPESCLNIPNSNPATGSQPIPDYILGTWTFQNDGDTYYFDITKTDDNTAKLIEYVFNDGNPNDTCYFKEGESTITVDANGKFIEDGEWDIEINQGNGSTLMLPDYWSFSISLQKANAVSFKPLCDS